MAPNVNIGQKRCFQCGAAYPAETLSCQLDDTPLCFDTVGRRWRVDGVLSRRSGGGVFHAFHLLSGQKAAVDLVAAGPQLGGAGQRLEREVKALRQVERHPAAPRLLEAGTDRDGSQFVVTDLGTGRPLRDWLAEWRTANTLPSPPRAVAMLLPVLSLLELGQRLSLGHGELTAEQVYLREGDASARLHGLAQGEGAPLQADLRGIAALIHELCTGLPPLPGATELPGVPARLGAALLRAMGGEYASAEEFSTGLLLAAPPEVPLNAPRVSMLMPALHSGRVRAVPPRVTQPVQALPLSPLQAPVRGGITQELVSVSLVDMMDAPAAQPRTQETLAVSANRPFTTAELLPVRKRPAAPALIEMEAEAEEDSLPVIEVVATSTRSAEVGPSARSTDVITAPLPVVEANPAPSTPPPPSLLTPSPEAPLPPALDPSQPLVDLLQPPREATRPMEQLPELTSDPAALPGALFTTGSGRAVTPLVWGVAGILCGSLLTLVLLLVVLHYFRPSR